MCIRTSCSITISKEMVEEYSALSRDYNPIHHDEQAAINNHFKSPIAHGMLVMGLGSEVVKSLAVEGCRIIEYEMSFLHPVFLNDSIQLVANGQEESNDIIIKGYVDENMVVKGRARYVTGDKPSPF